MAVVRQPRKFNGCDWTIDPIKLRSIPCKDCKHVKREGRAHLSYAHGAFLQKLIAFGGGTRRAAFEEWCRAHYPEADCTYSLFNNGVSLWRWWLIRSDSDTNRGPWQVTDAGHAFFAGTLRVPRTAVAFKDSGEVHRYEGQLVSYEEVLAMRPGDGEETYQTAVADIHEANGNPHSAAHSGGA